MNSPEGLTHLFIFNHVFYFLVIYWTLGSLPVSHAMLTLSPNISSYYRHTTEIVKDAKAIAKNLTDL